MKLTHFVSLLALPFAFSSYRRDDCVDRVLENPNTLGKFLLEAYQEGDLQAFSYLCGIAPIPLGNLMVHQVIDSAIQTDKPKYLDILLGNTLTPGMEEAIFGRMARQEKSAKTAWIVEGAIEAAMTGKMEIFEALCKETRLSRFDPEVMNMVEILFHSGLGECIRTLVKCQSELDNVQFAVCISEYVETLNYEAKQIAMFAEVVEKKIEHPLGIVVLEEKRPETCKLVDCMAPKFKLWESSLEPTIQVQHITRIFPEIAMIKQGSKIIVAGIFGKSGGQHCP